MKQKQSRPAAYFDVPAMNTTAIASQFKQVCEEVADAIREKKGSTDKILPKDFSSEIRSISGGGSVASQYAPRYFKIDWNKASEDWKYVLSAIDSNGINTTMLTIGSSYKIVNEENIATVTAYPFINIMNSTTYSFTYMPIFISKPIIDIFHIEHNPGIQTFENLIIFMNKLIPIVTGINVNITMEGITEITEEEFYDI